MRYSSKRILFVSVLALLICSSDFLQGADLLPKPEGSVRLSLRGEDRFRSLNFDLYFETVPDHEHFLQLSHINQEQLPKTGLPYTLRSEKPILLNLVNGELSAEGYVLGYYCAYKPHFVDSRIHHVNYYGETIEIADVGPYKTPCLNPNEIVLSRDAGVYLSKDQKEIRLLGDERTQISTESVNVPSWKDNVTGVDLSHLQECSKGK